MIGIAWYKNTEAAISWKVTTYVSVEHSSSRTERWRSERWYILAHSLRNQFIDKKQFIIIWKGEGSIARQNGKKRRGN